MRILISTEGEHQPPHHYMVVDNHGLLIDLAPLGGLGADPSITRIEWQLGQIPGEPTPREFGQVTRRGGVAQTTDLQRFFDLEPLKPLLAAFNARKAQLEAEQAAHDFAAAAAAEADAEP